MILRLLRLFTLTIELKLWEHAHPEVVARLRDHNHGIIPATRREAAFLTVLMACSTFWWPVTGAQMLDDLAGEAAQRALELRALAEKGARSRKKKALVDFMRALAQAGASAKRSAVPAAERGVHAWFAQVPPLLAAHATLARLPLSSERLAVRTC